MKKHIREPKRRFRGQATDKAVRARKTPVNLSIDKVLLADAKRMKINLSQTLEGELRRLTEDERISRWQSENREALESHKAYIERNGVFGEELWNLDDPSV